MRRVVHMTSEQFTNDFTEGLRGGGLPMFRRKYRDVDALLLDDIHFFVGKRSTLAEVRHTIDNLLRTGKQVVVSADRPLGELTGLGEELLGRLRGGLITPLFPLDDKIRLSLLKQLTTVAAIEIDQEVLQQLAERVAGDGRLIRGLVHRLTAVASMHAGKLPWEQCWSAVMDLVQATQPIVRMADIERVVCGIFGLEPDSLQSKSKMRSVSQPRMLAMFLARKYTPAAYKEIGNYFGQRRHSTVISAEKTVSAWLSENVKLEGSRHLSVRDAIRHVEAQLQVG
jgi:chromosomal replication initiator protein